MVGDDENDGMQSASSIMGEHEKEDMVTRMRTLHLSDQLDGGA